MDEANVRGEDIGLAGCGDVLLSGRSSAFRRQVLEVYDYQCTACGLRIWVADHELSFVDAAHLVPFSLTRGNALRVVS